MTSFVQIQAWFKTPVSMGSSLSCKDYYSQTNSLSYSRETILTPKRQFEGKAENRRRIMNRQGRGILCNGFLLPVDPWAPSIDSQSIASQLFAFSLFPYLGFLYFITKSKSAPKLTLFGFYFLLAFVGATIPAGIYESLNSTFRTAKLHYGTSLSNVDWLHGGAESLLTLTNIFIVVGLREAIRKATNENGNISNSSVGINEDDKPSI